MSLSTTRGLATLNVATTARILQSISSQLVGRLRVIGKILFWLVLLLNVRSLPFAWHVRVFWPTITLRLHYYRWLLPFAFKPRAVLAAAKESWLDSISPVGSNPYEHFTVYKTWAGLDDIDFNKHLSNSSYAKTLDAARLKTALAWFPNFFRAGGCMALAGTHFSFVREIPAFTRYEVRVSTFGWDNKWFFVIARFVSHSKNKTKKLGLQEERPATPDFHPAPRITTGIATPVQQHSSGGQAVATAAMAAKQLASGILQTGEPDGATLHCIHISQTCFKIGRVTVPPAVVLATNGFSSPPPLTGTSGVARTYSHANPPPHWKHVKALWCAPQGNMKTFATFLKGGWRDVPEGERWWETALAGPVEEKRKANMIGMDNLRNGMEVAKKPLQPLLRPASVNGDANVTLEVL